jgi:hypothetical protein
MMADKVNGKQQTQIICYAAQELQTLPDQGD